jgi:hypothetical protein
MLPRFPSNLPGRYDEASADAYPSRRRFLSASLGVAAGLGSVLMPAAAHADYYQRFQFELTGEHEWTDDYNRLNIVKQAMWIIDRRFLDIEHVVQNVLCLPSSRNAFSFESSAWDNLQPHYPALQLGDNLLWYQLLTIRKWMSPPDSRSGPTVFIYSAYKDNNAFAWGPYSTVTVEGDSHGYHVSGHFEVYLNFKSLGGSGLNSDPWTWASTIAHEMLHNLGHRHPESANDPTYERRQINAFTSALYDGNGRYRFGMRTPDVRCGGRRP